VLGNALIQYCKGLAEVDLVATRSFFFLQANVIFIIIIIINSINVVVAVIYWQCYTNSVVLEV
jgi:hypothetical protein